MGLGIVEELFIATDPTTSLKEVWYRNSNVTQSLQVRQYLNANPASVQWGTWKSQFVVRTGTTGATQRYFIFNLVRVGLSSGADGLGPSAVAHYVRTETPLTSTLPLINVSVDYRDEVDWTDGQDARWSTRSEGDFCPTFLESANGPTILSSNIVRSVRDSMTMTLGTLLTASSLPEYGLDAYGDLILVVLGTMQTTALTGTEVQDIYTAPTQPAPACDTTITCPPFSRAITALSFANPLSPRSGETHLWVVNSTRELVIFRTANNRTITERQYWAAVNTRPANPASPPYNTTTIHYATSASLACGGGSFECCDVGSVGNFAADSTATALGNFLHGITIKDDSLWGKYAFMSTVVDNTYAGTLTAKTGRIASMTRNGVDVGFGGTWNITKYVETKGDIYTVLGAWPISLQRPMEIVCWVRRTNTAGTRQDGLFLWSENTGRFTTISPFTAYGNPSLEVLTSNGRDLVWFIEGTGNESVYFIDMETGVQKRLAIVLDPDVLDRYYKMLTFRYLYQAEEPPGKFIDAWTILGDPIAFNLGNPPVVTSLTPFATLKGMPSGVTLPVIAKRYRRDVIMKDDWLEILAEGGVFIVVTDDGVGTDTGGPGDPVSRAIVLCSPSDSPAAFIARFPGRSDGAGGTPARLNVTASQRISENKFTSALSAQRYEDEPVIAFVVSAATSANLMLPQELQSSGLDTFRCITQTGLQAAPGTDTHRPESIELLLRRGSGSGQPGTQLMTLAPVTSNLLDTQGGTVGTGKDVPGLADSVLPVKAPVGQLVTGRFLGFQLTGTNVNSVLRYLGSLIRGHRTT